ncbi:hypothetical protein XBKQ1_1120001 [Xenorhabdus bovienii str. kraussei Quebec]|uniref:Uncharacterized protein n=1 Tax=Xenorhabdus bovienii str. kraussei Quebec TaxID=1398203 RepID=A0A077PF94_XENBV|nr:hypothetical protein [Xenorhabdus bovienii]CDH18324.1 hypothetical protein XBKQ1_1120001 [Xenorhabdus bovienii str. kraussei Quebec]
MATAEYAPGVTDILPFLTFDQSNAVVNIAFVEYSPGVILSDVFFNILLICNISPAIPHRIPDLKIV